MFRKLSLSLKNRNKEKGGGHVDGVNGVNGVYGAAARKKVASGLSTHDEVPEKQSDHTVSRSEVESSFTQFAHLVHAAQRPLPNQSGDGTYIEEKQQHSGLWADLRSLGFRDVKTLTEVMKNTASGALVDDKTMLMERVIQASSTFRSIRVTSLFTRTYSLFRRYLLNRRPVPTLPMLLSTSSGAPLSIRLSHFLVEGFNIVLPMVVGAFYS